MSDRTPRDQLAQIIYDTLNGQYGDFNMPDDAADAILDAGWRPPARVVTTVEELDALADMAVILDANCWEWIICQSLDPDNDQDPTAHSWAYGLGVNGPTNVVTLPATVLYDPEEAE